MPQLNEIDLLTDQLIKIHNEAIDAAIKNVMTGRTVNNFGHNPCCRRALEWVCMDLQELLRAKQRSTS